MTYPAPKHPAAQPLPDGDRAKCRHWFSSGTCIDCGSDERDVVEMGRLRAENAALIGAMGYAHHALSNNPPDADAACATLTDALLNRPTDVGRLMAENAALRDLCQQVQDVLALHIYGGIDKASFKGWLRAWKALKGKR